MITQWVGQAWQDISKNKKEIIAHFFEKTRCTMSIDGSNIANIYNNVIL